MTPRGESGARCGNACRILSGSITAVRRLFGFHDDRVAGFYDDGQVELEVLSRAMAFMRSQDQSCPLVAWVRSPCSRRKQGSCRRLRP